MNAIETKDLNFRYGNINALENINLIIPQEKFVSILGPNGSGKSTFLRILAGIIKPNSGKIKVFGQSIDEISSDLIGYVPQIKTLDRNFPAIAIELVLSGLNHRWALNSTNEQKDKANFVLEQLNAISYSKKPLNQLSGGQLQRIYLARCLVREPQLLLLDEPATGIDMICETNLNGIIQNFSKVKRTSILMVTHDWTSAYEHTEDVILLNRKLIYYGDKKNAFSNENLMQTFSHPQHHHHITFGNLSNV
ncbi:MAG: hypothetical protein A2X64_04035 [Ignavibacteria bacterium GWF2_33_9]|nr:MAG: hypothetical protein A2X64_04035 [Ignavibacteria bacterium GWF2_33_9]